MADLIQQGLTAARVGKLTEARRLLLKATAEQPDNVTAWLGLAGVVESLEEKRDCFAKALAIEPDNHEAQTGLTLVEQKLATKQADANSAGSLHCFRHAQTETQLRCNRCNRPICAKCARRTPVGFRCPDCIREQEDKYYTGTNSDYAVAAFVSFPLSLIAAMLFTFVLGGLGFWLIWISLFVAPTAAGFICEAVRWAVSKRRSRYLGYVTAGSLIVATVPFILMFLLLGDVWGLMAPFLLIFLGTPTIIARLR